MSNIFLFEPLAQSLGSNNAKRAKRAKYVEYICLRNAAGLSLDASRRRSAGRAIKDNIRNKVLLVRVGRRHSKLKRLQVLIRADQLRFWNRALK
jgi:hypothetical protein